MDFINAAVDLRETNRPYDLDGYFRTYKNIYDTYIATELVNVSYMTRSQFNRVMRKGEREGRF